MQSDDDLRQLQEAAEFLQDRLGDPPSTAFVLGSGLGEWEEEFPVVGRVDYARIPNFPCSFVEGHVGCLTVSQGRGRPFCALQGRVHAYEGVSQRRIVFAVRAVALWGIRDFVITNAAGAINVTFSPGQLMLICDHINLQGDNPLMGPNLDALGPRFPDMSQPYSPELLGLARRTAEELDLKLQGGVYVAVNGPSFETPAEIRMLRALGADAVGMSTVPEVIALNHMGKRILGISCLTNMAAGLLSQPLTHQEVLETTEAVKNEFRDLLLGILENLK